MYVLRVLYLYDNIFFIKPSESTKNVPIPFLVPFWFYEIRSQNLHTFFYNIIERQRYMIYFSK